MQLPEEFEERFNREFNGRYRIRWSDARGEWHLEQKVERGIGPGMVPAMPKTKAQYRARFDDMLRARDGYVLTLTITPGDRMPCPRCNSELQVPVKQFKHLRCDYCARRGRSTILAVGHFPFNDDLIYHLRKIDAYNDGIERVDREVKEREEYVSIQKEKATFAPMRDAIGDRTARLLNIPTVGRTGDAPMWEDAPAPNFTKVQGA
jgi:hypothetical protein